MGFEADSKHRNLDGMSHQLSVDHSTNYFDRITSQFLRQGPVFIRAHIGNPRYAKRPQPDDPGSSPELILAPFITHSHLEPLVTRLTVGEKSNDKIYRTDLIIPGHKIEKQQSTNSLLINDTRNCHK